MSHSPIIKSSFCAAVAVAAAMLVAAPAQATVYRGPYDPSYGGPFPDLGWKATVDFNVPNACLGQADGTYAVSGNCAGFSVLSAEVDFYNSTIDPNPLTSPVLESFSLNPGVFVNGVMIAGEHMVGVNTSFFSSFVPVGGSASIAGNGADSFSLILLNKSAQLAYAHPVTDPAVCAYYSETCGFSAEAPVGVFAPIPEPETYALMLAGLGALGFVARRRRQ